MARIVLSKKAAKYLKRMDERINAQLIAKPKLWPPIQTRPPT